MRDKLSIDGNFVVSREIDFRLVLTEDEIRGRRAIS